MKRFVIRFKETDDVYYLSETLEQTLSLKEAKTFADKNKARKFLLDKNINNAYVKSITL